MNEDVEDAEWEDVPGNGGSLHVKVTPSGDHPKTGATPRDAERSAWLSSEFWRDTIRVGCFGFIALAGIVALASFFHLERQAQSDPEEVHTDNALTDEVSGPEPHNQPAVLPSENAAIIDSCYHLDSCGAYKIISTDVVDRVGDERLVKAGVVRGEVQNAQGDASDYQRMRWSSEEEEIYALCSRTRPTIAFANDGGWLAEEFDFVNGIPGIQRDSANIYEALCHGFFDYELESRAVALGYTPLPDGEKDQFLIQDPKELLSP